MKKRVVKKKASRALKAYWLCFKRSASQGNHLSERQLRSFSGAVYAYDLTMWEAHIRRCR